jgi:4'-phosphopantetheinyl transferase EntD
MALFYQEDLTTDTKLAIWHIQEEESFFLEKVPLSKAIIHPHKRKQHLAGRFLLLHLFADFPLEEILIADSRKPYLQTERYHFSISHCGDYAAAIVSRTQRVGVDIEIFTRKVIRVQQKFLNQKELNFMNNHPDSIKLATTLWCAKEAIYKWFSFGRVNFKENILLEAFDFKKDGIIASRFLKDKKETNLETKYKIFHNLSLAFVSGEKKYPA